MQINNNSIINLHLNKGIHFFLPDQIIRLEAKSNYTKIFFSNQLPMLLARVLKDFEPALLPFGFVRTHRSHLVNKNRIVKIDSNGTIFMDDLSIAEISRRKRTEVLRQLQ